MVVGQYNKKIMKFIRKNNLLKNFVLVNGTARCGKSLVCPIIASFENVEIERMEGIFDYISVSHHLGSIETSCAISMLRTVADEFLYSSYLSRDTNFRWSDHSSVFNSPNKYKYFRRLFGKEGKDVIDNILEDSPIYQNQGHDQMQFVSLLLRAWPSSFKMIEIIRNPIDLVDAWWRRGWGTRFCIDPSGYTPCIDFNGTPVPFYAFGWEQEYLDASPMDRIIKMIYSLNFNNRVSYKALSKDEKKQILVIRFEDFVINTSDYIDKLACFLGTKTTKNTKKTIKKQGCPRTQGQDKIIRRLKNIEMEASEPYLLLLEEMIKDYKVDWV